ncbi:MAG: rod shape-determining protein [Acidobacteria bacterium]|nr:rod shape-determining protein [Acidobacteriota bacterium]
MLDSVFSNLRKVVADPDVAIDLGTANTRLYAHGKGIIADIPSAVKVNREKGSIEAVGRSALASDKNNSSIDSILPLRSGVIKDIEGAAYLLTPLLRRVRRFGLIKPRVLACAPTDATSEEREALVEATIRAGAATVKIAPEPLAAAIGVGLDISSPYAQMLVDIGDGVTDIAVIRDSTLVTTAATRIACSDLHKAIQDMVLAQYNLSISISEAEKLAQKIGVLPTHKFTSLQEVLATNLTTGYNLTTQINTEEISKAMSPVINRIITTICGIIRDLPVKTSCEVIESGISLTGGGACLPGMKDLIASKTCLDVRSVANPMHAVINGACQMLSCKMSSGFWLS